MPHETVALAILMIHAVKVRWCPHEPAVWWGIGKTTWPSVIVLFGTIVAALFRYVVSIKTVKGEVELGIMVHL
jgi:hypothetical protein